MDHADTARALFDALAQTDDQRVRDLCVPAMTVRQNGGEPMSLETLLRFNRMVHAVVADFRYEDIVCAATPTGFVEEHAVRGTLADGTALDLAACIVGDISAGKVTMMREYVDPAAAAPMLAALARRR